MKLLYLGFPKDDRLSTGGQMVDIKYRDILNQTFLPDVSYMDYSDAGMVSIYLSNKSISEVVALLNQYDVVIFDARGFTKFILNIRRIKKRLKPKMVGVLHHFYFLQSDGLKQRIIQFAELKTLSYMDSIIYSGIYPYELTKSNIFFKNVVLRYIGIGFVKEEIVDRDKKTNGNIVFIGHIIPRKGPHLLLNILKKLKEDGIKPVTYIIGDDRRNEKYTENLRNTIKENEMEEYVILTGRISDEEKERIVRNSGIFVFPSLCEGYGMVVLETMKYGIPAIVFNNTNLPYIVHDGVDGYVVENENWEGMAEKVKKVILDKDLYSTLSAGARNSYENVMTWSEVKDNLIEWGKDFFKEENQIN